jgi:hypothetical protein
VAAGVGWSAVAAGAVKMPGVKPGASEPPRRIGRSSGNAGSAQRQPIAGAALLALGRTHFHVPGNGALGRPDWSFSLPISLAGEREIPWLLRSGALLRAQPVDVALDGVTGDLPASADLERVDLAGGEQTEHEGAADAEQARRFLDSRRIRASWRYTGS